MGSILQRGITRLQKIRMRLKVLRYLRGRSGLEIGGPSDVFRNGNVLAVYEEIGSLDNCDFSESTTWTKHAETFVFCPGKPPGRTLFCEGSALTDVSDSTYDFVLSSHNLEHFANPVKALKEWQRVLKPTAALVLILPYYQGTFDHRRLPTNVDHMLHDFEQNVGEDDLTHLPEILEKHDLARDPAAGSMQDFHKRSLDNFSNRCLHHHVFDEVNSRALLSRVGFEVLAVNLVLPTHICILARTGNV